MRDDGIAYDGPLIHFVRVQVEGSDDEDDVGEEAEETEEEDEDEEAEAEVEERLAADVSAVSLDATAGEQSRPVGRDALLQVRKKAGDAMSDALNENTSIGYLMLKRK